MCACDKAMSAAMKKAKLGSIARKAAAKARGKKLAGGIRTSGGGMMPFGGGGRHAGKLASLLLALALFLPSLAVAQDRHGEITLETPEYQGVTANAPIPPDLHIRNEGGSDGAGLCVISSILANGRYQNVPGLEDGKGSALWRAAKSRPGGYYPEKLEKLLASVLPGERWFSWEGDGTDLLKKYSGEGYPIGATMSTGALYNYQSIHHMISLVHLDDKYACVVDNNDPGKYHWMPASEFARRFPDAGKGWGFVWLRKPPKAALLLLAAVVIAAAGVVLLFSTSQSRRLASS